MDQSEARYRVVAEQFYYPASRIRKFLGRRDGPEIEDLGIVEPGTPFVMEESYRVQLDSLRARVVGDSLHLRLRPGTSVTVAEDIDNILIETGHPRGYFFEPEPRILVSTQRDLCIQDREGWRRVKFLREDPESAAR